MKIVSTAALLALLISCASCKRCCTKNSCKKEETTTHTTQVQDLNALVTQNSVLNQETDNCSESTEGSELDLDIVIEEEVK